MNRHSNRPSSLSDEEFDRIRVMVETRLGVLVPLNKRSMIQSRLARRCRELGFDRAREYCQYLFGEGVQAGETSRFFDVVTTNYTCFYREPLQLDAFAADHLPGVVRAAHAEGRPLGVWSAACSTGEEVWTLCMLVDDARSRARVPVECRFLGTDVSTRVLEAATKAVYPQEEVEKLPEGWAARYFLRSRDPAVARVRVEPGLRSRAVFWHMNLMDASYPAPRELDIVFLRNVLIYFGRETRRAVVARLLGHLRPGGLLVVGTAESLTGLDLPVRHLEHSIYVKEPAA